MCGVFCDFLEESCQSLFLAEESLNDRKWNINALSYFLCILLLFIFHLRVFFFVTIWRVGGVRAGVGIRARRFTATRLTFFLDTLFCSCLLSRNILLRLARNITILLHSHIWVSNIMFLLFLTWEKVNIVCLVVGLWHIIIVDSIVTILISFLHR